MAKKLQLRRGTTSQHSSFTGAVGEVTVDTDKKVVVVHDGSTAGGVPLATAADIAGKQASDAELTELATMTSGTAGALADLTQTEVEILDGATVTTAELNLLDGVTSTTAELNILDGVTSTAAELNTLDGFTGDKDDLIYAKDLKATGVTATEYDYLDGVTSSIQTQLNAKGVGDATLAGTQTFTGTKNFDKPVVGTRSDVGTKTGAFDFDLSTANNFKVTVGATAEFGFTNPDMGQTGTIEVVNSGAYEMSWGNEVHFVGGLVPTITQSATSFLAYYCPSDTVVFVQHMLDVKQNGT